MKKILIPIAAVLVVILLAVFVGSGFTRISVGVQDYTVSEDGSEMTLTLFVPSSIGFIRKAEVYQQQGGRLYLDCYAAFGGPNGSIGAKSEFTVPLQADTEVIAIRQGSADCYREVLKKDGSGNWQAVQ